jgi:hypothetical protein
VADPMIEAKNLTTENLQYIIQEKILKRCRWTRIASVLRPSRMRVPPMPRQRLPSMTAALRDGVVADRGPRALINSLAT